MGVWLALLSAGAGGAWKAGPKQRMHLVLVRIQTNLPFASIRRQSHNHPFFERKIPDLVSSVPRAGTCSSPVSIDLTALRFDW